MITEENGIASDIADSNSVTGTAESYHNEGLRQVLVFVYLQVEVASFWKS